MRAQITFVMTPGRAYVNAAYDPDRSLGEQRWPETSVDARTCAKAWYAGGQVSLPGVKGALLLFRHPDGRALLQFQPRTCYACGIVVDKSRHCRRCWTNHCKRCERQRPRADHRPEDHQ